MKNNVRKSTFRKDKSKIYKIVIAIIVVCYIALYGLGKLNGDKDIKFLTKENEKYYLGDYEVYLLNDEYNTETKNLIAKFYIKEKPSNKLFIPLSQKNFSVETAYRDNISKKLKSKLIMPNKNFIIISVEDYDKDAGLINMKLNLKSDVIKIDKEKRADTNTTFTLSNKHAKENNRARLLDPAIYQSEGAKYQIIFIDKDIKSLEKKIAVLNTEIKNAEEEIRVIDKNKDEYNSEEKTNAELKQGDNRKFILENQSKINSTNKKIESLKKEKRELENLKE